MTEPHDPDMTQRGHDHEAWLDDYQRALDHLMLMTRAYRAYLRLYHHGAATTDTLNDAAENFILARSRLHLLTWHKPNLLD